MSVGNEAHGGDNNLNDNDNLPPFMGGDNSQKAYNQIADDMHACLDRWRDTGIDSLFALSVSLDILAQFCRDTLPAGFAEELIQDAVSPHEDED